MLKLKHLFESVWFGHKHFSKKMYTTGLIVFSGAVAVAVVMLGVNGFASTKHIDHVIAYESEEEEPAEKQELETLTTVEQVEESPLHDEALIKDSSVVSQLESETETLTEALPETEEATVTLMREESSSLLIEERNFRTNVNNIEETDVQLLSMKDYTALVRIVEAEATDEDLKGKILIANVVMNRVESKRFPHSIYDVVHQELNGRAQFSPIDDGRYYSVKITDSTIKAVEEALTGVDYSEEALFFVAKTIASKKASSWFDRNLEHLFTHDAHSFYKYY